MNESANNPRRTLSHFKRLVREGEDLAEHRPLDEVANTKWLQRAIRYVSRKMPDVTIASPSDACPVEMRNLLDTDYEPPDPSDAAVARAESGRALMRQRLVILAHAIEQLEAKLEAGD